MPHLHVYTLLVFSFLATGIAHPLPKQTAVYQCADSSDVPHYTDLGCGNKAVIELKSLDTLTFTPLTESEKQQLQQPKRPSSKLDRQQNNHVLPDKKRICQENANKIAALRDKRRKGYRLSESRALDRLEEKLSAIRRSQCM